MQVILVVKAAGAPTGGVDLVVESCDEAGRDLSRRQRQFAEVISGKTCQIPRQY
jgi:hypothetical protein